MEKKKHKDHEPFWDDPSFWTFGLDSPSSLKFMNRRRRMRSRSLSLRNSEPSGEEEVNDTVWSTTKDKANKCVRVVPTRRENLKLLNNKKLKKYKKILPESDWPKKNLYLFIYYLWLFRNIPTWYLIWILGLRGRSIF